MAEIFMFMNAKYINTTNFYPHSSRISKFSPNWEKITNIIAKVSQFYNFKTHLCKEKHELYRIVTLHEGTVSKFSSSLKKNASLIHVVEIFCFYNLETHA